jgi:Misato Segment II tubulin-like domain
MLRLSLSFFAKIYVKSPTCRIYAQRLFFSLQESLAYNNPHPELNHDILFREGLTLNHRDVTYLPRLVVVDLKGSLGLLPEFGDLYEDDWFPGKSKAQLTASGDAWLLYHKKTFYLTH